MKLFFEAKVKTPFLEVKSQFNEKLFLELKPPFMALELKRFDGCEKGHEVHLRMGFPGLMQNWVSHITGSSQTDTYWEFVDEGETLPPPLTFWRHVHRVEKLSDHTSRITDSIEDRCKSLILERLMWAPLWMSFAVRPSIYRRLFGEI